MIDKKLYLGKKVLKFKNDSDFFATREILQRLNREYHGLTIYFETYEEGVDPNDGYFPDDVKDIFFTINGVGIQDIYKALNRQVDTEPTKV